MNLSPEELNTSQTEASYQPSRIRNALGYFGIYFTIADIGTTISNHIPSPSHVTISHDALTVMSLGAATIGAVIMDRVFVHYHSPKPN